MQPDDPAFARDPRGPGPSVVFETFGPFLVKRNLLVKTLEAQRLFRGETPPVTAVPVERRGVPDDDLSRDQKTQV